ncbi:MAG TPA: ABC transporter ATP-binding protein [Acidimicrobiia bacterium]|nr:ABC transporter ATP-binding protein [Acidimicrobiia bacterium]
MSDEGHPQAPRARPESSSDEGPIPHDSTSHPQAPRARPEASSDEGPIPHDSTSHPQAPRARPEASSDGVGGAIRVSALEKRYGATVALAGLDFTVERGEVFGLLGPNGAGKTTTVEILEGYRTPDGGSVSVLGLDPVADGPKLRPRIGVMLQEGGLYPGLRPLELLKLFAAYYDDPADPDELLDLVGLRDSVRTYVRRLSGGQAQRLSLACALVGRPEVLFLDEPTAGMDPHARATTWQLVRDLRRRGTTILLTTHAMDEAEQLCDRVAIIAAGRLAAIGSPAELMAGEDDRELRFTVDTELDVTALATALGVAVNEIVVDAAGAGGHEYLVRVPGTPKLVAELACHLRDRDVLLQSLHTGRRSLEEVFLALTSQART